MKISLDSFARSLLEKSPEVKAECFVGEPSIQRLENIRLVFFDVYETLVMSTEWHARGRKRPLALFKKTIEFFGFKETLQKMANGKKSPSQFLSDMFYGEIEKIHKRKKARGIKFPEVRIETVWRKIIKRMQEKGFQWNRKSLGGTREFSLKAAYFFGCFGGKRVLCPYALKALKVLRKKGILLGIISNSQFYTPLHLSLLFEQRSRGRIRSLKQLFDSRFQFYSYRVGQAKPGRGIFLKALGRAKSAGIKPSEIAMVGNDYKKDLVAIKKASPEVKTVLFARNRIPKKKMKALKQNTRVNVIVTNLAQLPKVFK